MGGANGDLYKALQTLPGTQVQGETGELLVRDVYKRQEIRMQSEFVVGANH